MPKKPKGNAPEAPRVELIEPSYKVGIADGRVQAIEESMDAVAALIVKAESMIAAFDADVESSKRENADHTLRALYLAFAAITGAANGSAAFQSLLTQSKERLGGGSSTMH